MAGRQEASWRSANRAAAGQTPVRPRLSFADYLLYLWRAKWLMGLIAAILVGLGLLVATLMSERYQSTSRLYVRVDNQASLMQLVQGELDMMQSPVIAERTLARFPLNRLYPRLAEARTRALSKGATEQRAAIEARYLARSVAAFQDSFSAEATAHSPVVKVTFAHRNGAIAAEVLNAALASYLDYRVDIAGPGPVDALGSQLKLAETDLLKAEDAIASFLLSNVIADFDNQRRTAQGLHVALTSDLSSLQGQIRAGEQKRTTLRAQLAATAPELDMLVAGGPNERLLELQIEREELLARYTPNSQAVQNIEAQINRVETYLAGLGDEATRVRTQPNPTFQVLQASLNTTEAELAALNGQRADLLSQLAGINEQITLFNTLLPSWNTLTRERDLAELNVRRLADRQRQAGSPAVAATGEVAAIRILESAQIPSLDTRPRGLIVTIAAILGGILAVIAGLLQAVSRRGFATAGAVQRTIGLPVIGQIRRVRSRSGAKHR